MAIRILRRPFRRAQAFVELSLGMFALALVFSALAAFALFIVKSLSLQSKARSDAGRSALVGYGQGGADSVKTDAVELDPVAAEYLFGSNNATVKEKAYLPNMKGIE